MCDCHVTMKNDLQLLWEEERADEVRVRGPERDVTLVDVHHVGLRVETILLSSEVVGERQRREVTRSAERDTHAGYRQAIVVGLFEKLSRGGSMEDLCMRDV